MPTSERGEGQEAPPGVDSGGVALEVQGEEHGEVHGEVQDGVQGGVHGGVCSGDTHDAGGEGPGPATIHV